MAMTSNEWDQARDDAAGAALTLYMAGAETDMYEEDYRPTAIEVQDARRVMARWFEIVKEPMPDVPVRRVMPVAR
jgi:hypothetical protein